MSAEQDRKKKAKADLRILIVRKLVYKYFGFKD